MWLEMSKDETHGGGDWGFGKCLWSPAYKFGPNRLKSGYWNLLLSVQAGDVIVHLRGDGKQAAFVGSSVAETPGFVTKERPPEPEQWSYADEFYRVSLKDYEPFAQPITLQSVFKSKKSELRSYYYANSERKDKRKLFFVIQRDVLQCQFGAYLSEFDDELMSITLGLGQSAAEGAGGSGLRITTTVRTASDLSFVQRRYGQAEFSRNVKKNYSERCCFPGCNVSHPGFLIGSHIARWADVPELRGEISNGLCLCLMHDKAFEMGLFTIDQGLRVRVNGLSANLADDWARNHVVPFNGLPMKDGIVPPSLIALKHHWERTGFDIR